MAVSGSIDFTVTLSDIQKEVLEQLGVLAVGESPTADQQTSINRTINMVIKAMQADGMNLFALKKTYLFPQIGQRSYSLNSSTTDQWTESFVKTTMDGSAIATATSFDVTSSSGMTIGDQIGLVSSPNVHWTTISNISSNTITVADALPEAVTDGSTVYTFTTIAPRPMQIIEGYLHIDSNDTDIPLGKLSRQKYNELSAKGNTGAITQFYYDPQLDSGVLYVWATGNEEADYVTFFVQKTLSDMDSDSDTLEFPQEWFLPVVLQVAVLLAPKYGVPSEAYGKIRSHADMWYEKARYFDRETYTSVYLAPNVDGRDF